MGHLIIFACMLLMLVISPASGFLGPVRQCAFHRVTLSQRAGQLSQPLRMSTEEPPSTADAPVEDESSEDKYKREKLAEIADRKAAEVFISRSTGKYECQACGYVYDTAIGFPKKGISPGTPFDEIEVFRCPQCGANKKYFVAETETLSGFKENQKFGFGGNSMTAGSKSNLIFGALGFFVVLFLSGYLLE